MSYNHEAARGANTDLSSTVKVEAFVQWILDTKHIQKLESLPTQLANLRSTPKSVGFVLYDRLLYHSVDQFWHRRCASEWLLWWRVSPCAWVWFCQMQPPLAHRALPLGVRTVPWAHRGFSNATSLHLREEIVDLLTCFQKDEKGNVGIPKDKNKNSSQKNNIEHTELELRKKMYSLYMFIYVYICLYVTWPSFNTKAVLFGTLPLVKNDEVPWTFWASWAWSQWSFAAWAKQRWQRKNHSVEIWRKRDREHHGPVVASNIQYLYHIYIYIYWVPMS